MKPAPAVPILLDRSGSGSLASLLSTFNEILALDNPDAIVGRAVELARARIGLPRVGIFLLDRSRNLMLGTWGSDLRGAMVDEHHIMYAVSETDRDAFKRAKDEGAHFTVFDDCPIVEHAKRETNVAGFGWVACTPIRSARTTIGMLFNDTGLSGESVDPAKQLQAALLCSLLGTVLDPARGPGGVAAALPEESSAARRLVRAATTILAANPAMGGEEIAARLDVSLDRLMRVFKSEVAMSLVEYRNRLRLERFDRLLNQGRTNLLDAALSAGFGSYAQFHRVFRALRGTTPREYMHRRA